MFKNNQIAEFKNNFNYLKLNKGSKETDVALKLISDGSFGCEVLEDSGAWYLGEANDMKFNQLKTLFNIYEIPCEVFKLAENHIDKGFLVDKMD